MKKLFEILLVAIVFFSLGMYVGQEKDTTDIIVATTTDVVVSKEKEKPKPKSEAVKSKNLAVVYTFDEDIEAKYNELIEKKLKTIGFSLADPHKRVNDQAHLTYLDIENWVKSRRM